MPIVGPTTKEQGTQFSLDDIELAYLNSGFAVIPNMLSSPTCSSVYGGLSANTCYMNSIIQCLSHTLEMTDIFLCSSEDAGLVSSGEFRAKKIMQFFRTYIFAGYRGLQVGWHKFVTKIRACAHF